ncbi:hypothetical protein [Pantoea agglomerans]|uniref:hypothetical protein n=1 Tax=Enterobacter agglomerans TaxID=549 RepID=UPI00177CDEE5|nr:hypothetical protein [Pantoea agglomerans]MBD8154078.1 hypothetical protein [Pantoea agglomerans]MBD8242235.1 hypothetical protein [Pantoea agglomerans]
MKHYMTSRLHVVKVPSTEADFFPYSHFADEHSAGPILELFMSAFEGGYLRISGLAKLKPNFQKVPKLRLDIYGPHHGLIAIAECIERVVGKGNAHKHTLVNPENSRKGPQTLPDIEQQYEVVIDRVEGKCHKYVFFGADRMFFDHEFPKSDHVEMKGKEFHFGIRLRNINILAEPLPITFNDVPLSELRNTAENNPVSFSPITIRIFFTFDMLRNFAATVLESYEI